MIKVEKIDTWGFEHALRGMRNPLNSWDKADSEFDCYDFYKCDICQYADTGCEPKNGVYIGSNDLKLMKTLFKAGTEHRKFMRQIFVSMDITSHHAWWAEFDTYKIGTTRNSCSKMHKIHVKEFVKEDFSHEGLDEVADEFPGALENTIDTLEKLRKRFNQTQKKKYWRAIIELLPMGYNLKATVTMNYENAASMLKQRENHKLDEWKEFVKILKELPYMEEIIE